MPITPFTQPVEQGKFIPREPRLPTEAIGSAAQNIYKQDVKQRDRLRQAVDRVAQQKASGKDQGVLRQIENKYRERFNKIAEDDLLFGDRQKITEAAREFAQEAQLLEKNKQAIQQQLKSIDNLENLDESEKERRKAAFLQDAGLKIRNGTIDPDSVFSPQSVGEEPESLKKTAREMAQELPERFQGEGAEFDPQTGKIKFTESSGVGPQRISNYLLGRRNEEWQLYGGALTDDPEVRNWMRQEKISLMRNRGYSEEQAQEAVNTKLKNSASSIIDNFSYQDINISRESIDDGEEGGGGSGDTMPAISVPAPMQSPDQLSGADREEAESHKKYVSSMALKDMFKGTDLSSSEINEVSDILNNPTKYGVRQKNEKVPGPQSPGGSIESDREMALRLIEKKHDSDVADRVREEYDDTVNRLSSSASLSRRRWVTPSKDTRLAEVQRAFRAQSRGNLKSEDIDAIEGESIQWFESSRDFKNRLKGQVLNYGQIVGMTQDGSQVQVRMPSDNESIDSSIQGQTVSVDINDKAKSSLSNAFANVVGETDPWTAEAMRNNIQYQDVAVETRDPTSSTNAWDDVELPTGGSGKARYNPQIGGFQVGTEDNSITFGDVIKAEGYEVNNKIISGFLSKIPKFKQEGVDTAPIDSFNELHQALRAEAGKEEFQSEQQKKAIRQILDKSVPFEHKGMALDYLSKMNNN